MKARQASIVLLLAQERSGTHLLRSILGAMPRIAAPGETCNAAADVAGENKLSFFEFRRAHLAEGGNSPYPTFHNQEYLVSKFFEYIADQHPDRDFVIADVKYAHVHNFNSFWWNFSDRPFLLQYAREHRMKIIHLVRENIFQTAISRLYAAQSGVWRASSVAELKSITITVEAESLKRQMNKIRKAISLFDDWLLGSDSVRITYEALSGPAPEVPLRAISVLFGLVEAIPFSPGFVKTTPPYEECIANWSEIRELAAAYDR
jgi:hypothetical protein